MVSLLDAGLVSIFTGLFIFLLVYALVFGFLTWQKWFGERGMGYSAIISFVVALFAAIAPPVRNFIIAVTPWYIALFLVLFFILFIVTIFGVSPTSDFPALIKQPRVYAWIVIFCVIIALFGLGATFGPLLTPGGGAAPAPVDTAGYDVIGGGNIAQPGQLAPVYAQRPAGQPGPGEPGSTATNDFGINLINTLFHPKVLGLIATIVIAALTVLFLSMPPSP